jgi:serine/threonine protein kinase/ankyrin repeat protein
MDVFGTTSTYICPRTSFKKSSVVPGVSLHSAIHSATQTNLQDDLISFLSYVRTKEIPIIPIGLPDVRCVLGQGLSFLVNGAEVPETYIDRLSGVEFPKGMIVAMKRSAVHDGMTDIIGSRIKVLFNEVLTMCHPPLLAHPNIVKLLGICFEIEGPMVAGLAMPVLVVECAESGNLAEVLETARKEERPLGFEEKLALCVDVAHGLEILHACDIVHGDVKCENVLVFENDCQNEEPDEPKSRYICKLTDFGISTHTAENIILGGSRPWQAPECTRGAYFKLEGAKCTDIYSFGMLLWRVMLDGDPFKSLGEFEGNTAKDRREKRNDAIALLKEEDRLVKHVCDSLTMSGKFSNQQLDMLHDVIRIILTKDPSSRELDIGRLIRLLMPNKWYQRRHPVSPRRISIDLNIQLLDIEKDFASFKKISQVAKQRIVNSFQAYTKGSTGQNTDGAAAFQLAICYAMGFGVPIESNKCLKWLAIAANEGSRPAREALPLVAKAFDIKIGDQVDIRKADRPLLVLSSPSGDRGDTSSWELETELSGDEKKKDVGTEDSCADWTMLQAAEVCRYDIIELLLSQGVKPEISEDGVTPLHFLSTWDENIAERLGQKLILAGADVNARAKRGVSVGGTPLMWSVYGDHLTHSAILIRLGADPMVGTGDGIDALFFASQLHLASHLRLLLENLRPVQVRGHMRRLFEGAASGESRFARITRHTSKSITAAIETLQLLLDWNHLFPDSVDPGENLLLALRSSLDSDYGPMNTDVHAAFIDKIHPEPSMLIDLLHDSVTHCYPQLFDLLLKRKVPVTGRFDDDKTLLHLCARITDEVTPAEEFAPRLLELGIPVDSRDKSGYTPFMDAVLARQWNLADLLLAKGAGPLSTNNDGYNVMGLCIKTLNLGAQKYLLKYCAARSDFCKPVFLVHPKRKISALQEAAAMPLQRSHGMKVEAIGIFLLTLATCERENIDFCSDGILESATALDIATSNGNVHAVKNLVKHSAHLTSGKRAVELARAKLTTVTEYLPKLNLERCIFIIENWNANTAKLADDWTNMRTIDDSHVNFSWEHIAPFTRNIQVLLSLDPKP